MDETTTQPAKGGMNPMIIVGGIVLLIAAAAFFMTSGNRGQTTPVEDAIMPVEESVETLPAEGDEAMMDYEGGITTINVEAGSYFYNPSEIRARQGDTVRVVLTAADMMHDFNIDELGVKSEIVNEGESTTIEFFASEAGEYEYYCSVGNHRQQGQVGKLIVE